MRDPCEVCGKEPAIIGVQEVKLCQTCFNAIAAGREPEFYARFTALAKAKAPAAQQRAEDRARRIDEAEKMPQQRARVSGQPAPQSFSQALAEGAGAGAFGGAVAGLAAHHLAQGKMTFPIFIVAYILILGGLKGRAKFVGLVVFTAVAAFMVALFQHLEAR